MSWMGGHLGTWMDGWLDKVDTELDEQYGYSTRKCNDVPAWKDKVAQDIHTECQLLLWKTDNECSLSVVQGQSGSGRT